MLDVGVGKALGSDFKYGRERKRAEKIKRHPLNFIFDPLYPMIVVATSLAIGSWYLDIHLTQRLLDFDLGQLIMKWTH